MKTFYNSSWRWRWCLNKLPWPSIHYKHILPNSWVWGCNSLWSRYTVSYDSSFLFNDSFLNIPAREIPHKSLMQCWWWRQSYPCLKVCLKSLQIFDDIFKRTLHILSASSILHELLSAAIFIVTHKTQGGQTSCKSQASFPTGSSSRAESHNSKSYF